MYKEKNIVGYEWTEISSIVAVAGIITWLIAIIT